jgi:hypothetical protein
MSDNHAATNKQQRKSEKDESAESGAHLKHRRAMLVQWDG